MCGPSVGATSKGLTICRFDVHRRAADVTLSGRADNEKPPPSPPPPRNTHPSPRRGGGGGG
eukprot:1462471-Alexandrium_andersonii.AAC.1